MMINRFILDDIFPLLHLKNRFPSYLFLFWRPEKNKGVSSGNTDDLRYGFPRLRSALRFPSNLLINASISPRRILL